MIAQYRKTTTLLQALARTMEIAYHSRVTKLFFVLVYFSGTVAQSVEQWPFKPTVVGSIPTGPTNKNSA